VTAQASAEQPASFRQHRFVPPPGATELVLVRHGESEAYVDGQPFALVGGQGDPPLSANGVEQARRVCARLATEPVKAIYVTTLQRTGQTAAALGERLGIEPQTDADLREVHLGDWEGGLYRKMVAENHPVIQQVSAQERWDLLPGGETNAALAARVRGSIERIAASHPDECVAAFTHGGVIGMVMALASGSRPFAFLGAANASISRIVITGDRWIVRTYNDTAHLDDLVLPA
jgi:2,3-bisphosphoglycerate-dependent phosphoglycerate mutase